MRLRKPRRPRPVLVRGRDAGDFTSPGARPVPHQGPVLRWGRPLLLPLSSPCRLLTPERLVALTYDDGPDPRHTPAVLDALARDGSRATFFVLVDAARRHPGVLRRILDGGHEIGLHGTDHARLSGLPALEVVRRIRTGRRQLEDLTGSAIGLFRPAYGESTLAVHVGARVAGLQVVLWSAWARDWVDGPADQVAGRAVRAAHPGAVVLLHDATADPDAVPDPPSFCRGEVTGRVLSGLRRHGYRVAPVGELLTAHPAVRVVTLPRPRRR